jgi:putative tryptophan/tyrosine transport system substrate-binding protein
MQRRALLALAALMAASAARTQARMPRIGFLWMGFEPDALFEAFRLALRGLGYDEGINVAFVHRYGRASHEGLIRQAAELVRLDMDVIVAAGGPCAVVAQRTTRTVPIVFYMSADPAAAGLVASFERPGANLTGVSILAPQQGEQCLALLTQAVRVSRIGVLWNPDDPQAARELEVMKAAAHTRKLQLLSLEVRGAGEFARSFEAAARDGASALCIVATPFIVLNLARVADLARIHRLPSIFWNGAYARHGGLMAYGPSDKDIALRVATLAVKIMKGANPGELPVERPTRSELVINMNTARALGLSIPRTLLAQADHVIG